MSSYGVYCVKLANDLAKVADFIAALSLEAYDGLAAPFDALIHKARQQKGQQKVAKRILGFLEGSQMLASAKAQTQDPYSFRCVPQVHGASLDAISAPSRRLPPVTIASGAFVTCGSATL